MFSVVVVCYSLNEVFLVVWSFGPGFVFWGGLLGLFWLFGCLGEVCFVFFPGGNKQTNAKGSRLGVSFWGQFLLGSVWDSV